MLVVDYADSTASANMIVVKLVGFELGQIENESLSVHMDLDITNPARGHVNITYLSYQLVVEGEYVAGGSRVFSPNLVLNAVSSADLHLTLDIPDSGLQVVLHAPKKAVELLVFMATKTNYDVGTLRFTFQP
jgi:LEA14-like dessication related protein